MEEQFNNPTCKKMKLWDDISKQMMEMGIHVNGNDCYSKYRNLLQTYRRNKERSMKTGESRVQWEFFENFDTVLGNKASTIPPANILSTSINQTEPPVQTGRSEELSTVATVSSTPEPAESLLEHVPQHKKNKKNVELSIPQYLFYKREKDEEKWREKKELKLKEIAAINNVANALRALSGQNPSTASGSSHKKRKYSESESD